MLAFGLDGYLYISLGDGGPSGDPRMWAQETSNLFGTIARIDVESRSAGAYGIPPGNLTGSGVAPEIWSYGLRNPWRFSVDGCTGDVYIGDVGQNEFEEVDVHPWGAGPLNFGWSVREARVCYNANSCEAAGIEPPVVEYGHGEGLCVIGGYVYRGSAIPALRGSYIYGDYSSKVVWAFDYVGGRASNHRQLFAAPLTGSGIVSFGQDAEGEVYIVKRSGQILKIVAAGT
jgi:glucose/arabinose dehydrogenase